MSLSGSVPTRLGVSTDTFNDKDENAERKRFLENEIGGLLKQKSRLVEDNGKLVKSAQELQDSLKQLRERMVREREEHKKLLQEERTKALEELAIKERELGGREDELEAELESLVEIYEYATNLLNELVWESDYNATEATNNHIVYTNILKEKRRVDDLLSEAEETTKKLRLSLLTAENKQHEDAIAIGEKLRAAYQKLDEAEVLKKELLDKKTILLAKHEKLEEREKALDEREAQLRDREETLKRSLQSRV